MYPCIYVYIYLAHHLPSLVYMYIYNQFAILYEYAKFVYIYGCIYMATYIWLDNIFMATATYGNGYL